MVTVVRTVSDGEELILDAQTRAQPTDPRERTLESRRFVLEPETLPEGRQP